MLRRTNVFYALPTPQLSVTVEKTGDLTIVEAADDDVRVKTLLTLGFGAHDQAGDVEIITLLLDAATVRDDEGRVIDQDEESRMVEQASGKSLGYPDGTPTAIACRYYRRGTNDQKFGLAFTTEKQNWECR